MDEKNKQMQIRERGKKDLDKEMELGARREMQKEGY